MDSLYLDISEYLPNEEVKAVDRTLEELKEEYDLIPSKMNEPQRRWRKRERVEAQPLSVY